MTSFAALLWVVVTATGLHAQDLAAIRPPVRTAAGSADPLAAPQIMTAQDKADQQALMDKLRQIRAPARRPSLPRTRWQHMGGNEVWTRAALSALKTHGQPLTDLVPGDIANWCPAYPQNDASGRRAFWVGFMSALAKHESTYKPWAVGGGGKWYGLLQILPATARGYKCHVGTGEELKNGAANLSCAARIMAHTVPRDGVIHARNSKWRGVSADWGPMRDPRKRADMANWLKQQSYCIPVRQTRPQLRPEGLVTAQLTPQGE